MSLDKVFTCAMVPAETGVGTFPDADATSYPAPPTVPLLVNPAWTVPVGRVCGMTVIVPPNVYDEHSPAGGQVARSQPFSDKNLGKKSL